MRGFNNSCKRSDALLQQNKSAFIQPKLTVNQPNDTYEQEADAVANKMLPPEHSAAGSTAFFKPPISSLQRSTLTEETSNTLLQNNNSQLSSTQDYIHSLSGGNTLSRQDKHFFESRMGYDFGQVKLHTDTAANESAKSIQAKAYTHGNDIVFAAGEYQPETNDGKKLIAHELTHVVQQQSTSSQVQREEQKPDRYEELKDDKKAKEVFEKLNPATLGRYCTQNCPAVAEALEEYLKTGVFPETHCDPLGEGNYGYDVSDTEFSDKIVGWDKFWKKASPNLKKHGDFLVIEAERTEKQAKDNNLTQWHYFLILNIKDKNFVVDAYTKEVTDDISGYTTRLVANSYRHAKGDFKIKKVRVSP